jgi:hypothetical protein
MSFDYVMPQQSKTTFTCPYITKYHFMVREGIVLGHLVSERGIKVDKAKIEVIERLPPPVNIKGI